MRRSRLAATVALGAALLVSPVPVLAASGSMGPACGMSETTADCCAPDSDGDAAPRPCCRLQRPVPPSPALLGSPSPDVVLAEIAAPSIAAAPAEELRFVGEVPARSRTVPLFLLHSTLLV